MTRKRAARAERASDVKTDEQAILATEAGGPAEAPLADMDATLSIEDTVAAMPTEPVIDSVATDSGPMAGSRRPGGHRRKAAFVEDPAEPMDVACPQEAEPVPSKRLEASIIEITSAIEITIDQ